MNTCLIRIAIDHLSSRFATLTDNAAGCSICGECTTAPRSEGSTGRMTARRIRPGQVRLHQSLLTPLGATSIAGIGTFSWREVVALPDILLDTGHDGPEPSPQPFLPPRTSALEGPSVESQPSEAAEMFLKWRERIAYAVHNEQDPFIAKIRRDGVHIWLRRTDWRKSQS